MAQSSDQDPRAGVVKLSTALGRAWLDASLAGVAAAVADTILAAVRGGAELRDAAVLALVMIGLCAGVIGLVGAPIVLAVRGLSRLEPIAGAASRVRAGGRGRVEVVAGLACGVIVLAILWWVAFEIIVYTHAWFNDGRFAAIIAAALIVVAVVVAGFVVTAAAPPAVRWLGARRSLVAMVSGRAGVILVVIGVCVLGVVADGAIRRLAPAWDRWPSYVVGVGAAGLIVVSVIAPASRLRQRWAVSAGIAVVVAAALVVVGRADRARAITSRSAIATHVHMTLVALTDGDGDGVGDGFGGPDCDDADARVHPLARELAGNGRDDNCVAGDADPRRVAERRGPRTPALPQSRPDILLITIDSLRADHTSLHGYRRATTPNLVALAARGTRFDRAITPSPSTRRAIPALLFGRHASTLPFEGDTRPVLAAHDIPSLPSELARAGYRTGAILSHQNLPLSRPTFAGFDDVIGVSTGAVSRHQDNADDVANRAIEWLARDAARPRFAWIHFIDPHHPYEPRIARFGAGRIAGYDAAIAFVDEQLARVVATIDMTRTIVIVTADHGDAFGEHHTTFHGRVLHDEETHVPLVIAVPGAPASVVGTPVSLVDIAPTLLELIGVAVPNGMTGASYAEAIRGGEPPAARPVLAEILADGIGRPAVAAWIGDRKIIRDVGSWTMQAYDLSRDPGEHHPLSYEATMRYASELDALTDLDLARLPGE